MKISVIVPVYNTEEYLDKCLESLVNQTLEEIEIIVINDGSKGNVDEIIKKYKDKIIYFKNDNHGIGYTRNFGIKKAKGEYIGFVDSDDYVDKDMYLNYYEFAKKNNLDIVVGNYRKIGNKNIGEIKLKHFEIGNIYDHKDILINFDYGPCTKIFKRSLITNHGIMFEDHLKYEDMPFVVKALKYAGKVGHLDKPYYNYVVRSNSETTTVDTRSFDIFKVFDIVLDIFKTEKKLDKEIEYLVVSKLLDYNIHQRYQKSSIIRNEFISKSFNYINENFPNYRQNKYLKQESILKRIIKQNKLITQIYCLVYPK